MAIQSRVPRNPLPVTVSVASAACARLPAPADASGSGTGQRVMRWAAHAGPRSFEIAAV